MAFWRVVFALAAAFNLAVGFAMLLAPQAIVAGALSPREMMLSDTAALLIVTFGLGYAMVARRPRAHAGIALLGVVGKAMMPMVAWVHFARDAIPLSAFLLSLGDLVFAGLFVAFLVWNARTPA
jgi:hypothetical protein